MITTTQERTKTRRRLALLYGILGIAAVSGVVGSTGCMTVDGTAGGCSWTGTWNTDSDGTMMLIESGIDVMGSYSSPPGQFSGTVSGNTLTGNWTQHSSGGACPYGPQIMTMSADCSRFTGTYHYCDESGGSGAIDGTRSGPGSGEGGGSGTSGGSGEGGGGVPAHDAGSGGGGSGSGT